MKYILDQHKHVQVQLWVQDYFLPIAQRSFPKNTKNLTIRPFADVRKHFDKSIACKAFSAHKYNNLASHMTEHAFCIVANSLPPDLTFRNYVTVDVNDVSISRFNLPKKYVVIPTNYTSMTRALLGVHFNEIKEYILSKGYQVVVLGREQAKTSELEMIHATWDASIDFTNTINLLNKTTLLESAKILRNASFVVGLDNGLLHLAAATGDVPIVFGLTTVLAEHRLPYRRGVLGYNCYPVTLSKQELECVGCQSNMNFTWDFKFTECYYDDLKCLELLSADKYIEQIDKVLETLK